MICNIALSEEEFAKALAAGADGIALFEYKDGKRVREITEPCVVEVERYYPPDTTAEIFWMKKRKPEQWGDKDKNVNVEGMVQIVDNIPD